MIKPWTPAVLYSALTITAISIATALYWALIPIDILVIKNNPVPIRPLTNTPGNAEVLVHDFCKLTNDKGTLRVSFVGAQREIFLPMTKESAPKQCNERTELPIIIPQGLLPGKYHVHFRATYNPNPLRSAVVEWDSQEFNVQ